MKEPCTPAQPGPPTSLFFTGSPFQHDRPKYLALMFPRQQWVESSHGKAGAGLLTTRHDRGSPSGKLSLRLFRVSSARTVRRRAALSLRYLPPSKWKRLFRQCAGSDRKLASAPQPSSRQRIPVLTRSLESILFNVRFATLCTRRVGPGRHTNTPRHPAEGDSSKDRRARLGRFDGGLGSHRG